MSRTKLPVIFPAFFGLMVCSSSIYAAITVDGNLSDWGISCSTSSAHSLSFNSAYGYTPSLTQNLEATSNPTAAPVGSNGNKASSPLTVNNNKIFYDIEDSNDNWDHSKMVGPLYGGQDYDAEALLVSVVHNASTNRDDLYIAISTGQRPDNVKNSFAPGDICIKGADGTLFGIEVGGGTGGKTLGSGVQENKSDSSGYAVGTTYKLDSSGYTNSSTNIQQNNLKTALSTSQTAGSIWEGGTWDYGVFGSQIDGQKVPTQLETGGKKGGKQ